MLREWVKEALGYDQVETALSLIDTGGREYDEWGFSPAKSKRFGVFAFNMFRYFRPDITGIENVPSGRVLLVANHSGQLPYDALVISVTCLLKAVPPRWVRTMVERWVPTVPFINVFFSRAGAVVGDPVNCRNLLERENAILVFPEGAKGSGKPWSKRYQLQNFGRGFMRLALQTNTPIVPISVVGAEESIVSVTDLQPLARRMGVPYIPVPALLPVLGPLSMFPLPTKFYVDFGQPMRFEGPFDDEDEVIDQKVIQVKSQIDEMMQRRLAQRDSVF
ncbi:MAG: lysophospholipid acyltransferase family protein [Myxococcota bacterium]